MISGLAIVVYAFSSGGDVWKEFYQYFQGSKFVSISFLDIHLDNMTFIRVKSKQVGKKTKIGRKPRST